MRLSLSICCGGNHHGYHNTIIERQDACTTPPKQDRAANKYVFRWTTFFKKTYVLDPVHLAQAQGWFASRAYLLAQFCFDRAKICLAGISRNARLGRGRSQAMARHGTQTHCGHQGTDSGRSRGNACEGKLSGFQDIHIVTIVPFCISDSNDAQKDSVSPGQGDFGDEDMMSSSEPEAAVAAPVAVVKKMQPRSPHSRQKH